MAVCCVCGDRNYLRELNSSKWEFKFLKRHCNSRMCESDTASICYNCVRQITNLSAKMCELESKHQNTLLALDMVKDNNNNCVSLTDNSDCDAAVPLCVQDISNAVSPIPHKVVKRFLSPQTPSPSTYISRRSRKKIRVESTPVRVLATDDEETEMGQIPICVQQLCTPVKSPARLTVADRLFSPRVGGKCGVKVRRDLFGE